MGGGGSPGRTPPPGVLPHMRCLLARRGVEYVGKAQAATTHGSGGNAHASDGRQGQGRVT